MCMTFLPRYKSNIFIDVITNFMLGGILIDFCDSFRYLGHGFRYLGHGFRYLGHGFRYLGHGFRYLGHGFRYLGHGFRYLGHSFRYLGHGFRYLGHNISNTLDDRTDVLREIRSIFFRCWLICYVTGLIIVHGR